MKRLYLFFGTLAIGILVFTLLISRVGWNEILEALSAFSFSKALVVVLLTAIFLWVGGMRWQRILKGQGYSISLPSIMKLYIAGFSLVFFLPMIPFANEFFRASAIEKGYSIPFTTRMSSVVIDRILEVTSNLLVIIAGVVIFLFLGNPTSYSVKMAAIALFIAIWLVLFVLLYVRIFQKKSIIRIFWRKNGEGVIQDVEKEVFRFFHWKNRFFWEGIFFSLFKSFTGIVRTVVVILFFGKGLLLIPGITIMSFSYLAVLVPIPAALGAHDALQVTAFQTFGLGAATGAAFTLVMRAVEALFAGAGLIFVLLYGVSITKALFLGRPNNS